MVRFLIGCPLFILHLVAAKGCAVESVESVVRFFIVRFPFCVAHLAAAKINSQKPLTFTGTFTFTCLRNPQSAIRNPESAIRNPQSKRAAQNAQNPQRKNLKHQSLFPSSRPGKAGCSSSPPLDLGGQYAAHCQLTRDANDFAGNARSIHSRSQSGRVEFPKKP